MPKKTVRVGRVCEQCGSAFECYESELRRRPVRFCSVSCARANQIGRPNPCTSRNLSVRACQFCGTEYMPRHVGSRFCSRPCMSTGMRGEHSANWRGGRHVDVNGYAWVRMPDHPRAKGYGYVKEHVVVMERTIGRFLTRDESVHHINGDRSDNDPSNLQLRGKRHGKGIIQICGDCGSSNVIAAPIATPALRALGDTTSSENDHAT